MLRPESKNLPHMKTPFEKGGISGLIKNLKEAYKEIKTIVRHYRTGEVVEVEPLITPKGLHVEKWKRDETIIYIKSSRARWGWLPMVVFVFGWFVISPIVSFIFGIIGGIFGGLTGAGGGATLGFIVSIFIWLWATYSLYAVFLADLKITVLKDRVIIAEKSYNRAHFSRFTLGNDQEKESVEVGNGFLDSLAGDGSFGGVRFYIGYGQWGEYIDFKVARRYAVQYVLVLNNALDFVADPVMRDHDPQAGRPASGL